MVNDQRNSLSTTQLQLLFEAQNTGHTQAVEYIREMINIIPPHHHPQTIDYISNEIKTYAANPQNLEARDLVEALARDNVFPMLRKMLSLNTGEHMLIQYTTTPIS